MSLDERIRLTTETVESAALSLEGIDDVEGCDSLSLSVFGVGDSVPDDTFEEGLEDTTSFFVDHWRRVNWISRMRCIWKTY